MARSQAQPWRRSWAPVLSSSASATPTTKPEELEMAELKIADETSVATMEKAAKFRTIGGLMTFVADQTDFCPYCRSSFEIICVKFRFNGATMIATCPNCGMACAERWGAAEILNSAEKSYRTRWNFWPGIASMMDALNLRFQTRCRFHSRSAHCRSRAAPHYSRLRRLFSRRNPCRCTSCPASRSARNHLFTKKAQVDRLRSRDPSAREVRARTTIHRRVGRIGSCDHQ